MADADNRFGGWPTAMPAGRTLGKIATVVALTCVASHIPVLLAHLAAQPVLGLLMTVISCACVMCAPSLWNGPVVRDWLVNGALAGAMLVLHLAVVLGHADSVRKNTSHYHGPHSAAGSRVLEDSMGFLFYGASSLAFLQLLLAGIVLTTVVGRHRRRNQSIRIRS